MSEIKLTSRLVLKKISSDGTDAIRIEDGVNRSITADQDTNGRLSLDARTASRQNETGTLKVAEILVEKLNEGHAALSAPRMVPGKEQGIDCIAEMPTGGRALIQVTRPARQSFWHRLARLGRGQECLSVEEGAGLLFEAIQKKAHRTSVGDRHKTILALDVTDTPNLGLDAVVQEFGIRYRNATAEIGFAAVWLVGELPSLTYRIDN